MSATATLKVTADQVVALLDQFPADEQLRIYQHLSRQVMSRWGTASEGLEETARQLARERGLDLDVMTDEQRIAFIDDLLHEWRRE